jgi:hypothetical protein
VKLKIPRSLQEIFGVEQSVVSIIMILLFGAMFTTMVVLRFPDMYEGLPLWRQLLSFILIFDIFCGCIANFTESTNNYYAERGNLRIIFIAVHIHIILLALLLDTNAWFSLWVWLYTIASAFIINALQGQRQRFVGKVLLAVGIGWIPMLPNIDYYFLIISLLFMLKVLYAFSVNHYTNKV